MARPTSAARRYAEAAFELATADNAEVRWAADLALAAGVVSDPTVMRALSSPAIPLGERRAVLDRAVGERVAPPIANLAVLLMLRRRLDMMPAISTEFQRLLDRANGVVEATVTSVAPLDDHDMGAVKARAERMTHATVRLAATLDPLLIGGLTVRVGDRLLDASVRGRLERLRSQLVAGSRGTTRAG